MAENIPTLYEWLGGMAALDALTVRFYERVRRNEILAPVFAHMGPDHPHHVAAFLAEVLGGPTEYSQRHGGHPHMIRQHLERHLSQAQRREWVGLLLDTAAEGAGEKIFLAGGKLQSPARSILVFEGLA